MAASSKGDVGMVDMMLSQGAAVNQAANNGWTPLFYAAFGDHADVLRHLIAAGAHAEHPVERNQCTALGIAARVGNVAAVRTLVEHGADVCAKDWHRMAPIDYAWNDEVRQILQKEGDRRKAAALSVMPGEMHADVKQNIIDKLS